MTPKEIGSHLWPGVPLALASAVLFGASTPFSKLLLADAPPQLLAGLLYVGAGLGLAALQLVRTAAGLPSAEAPLRRSDGPWLAAVVLCGGVIGPLLLMLGLARTEAASAALLLNLEGLATMTIAWLVFKESVDERLFSGAMAILAGAAVLSWRGGGVYLDSGALLVAGACLAWGIDNNLTRKLSAADPVSIAMIKGVVAGAANVLMALTQGEAAASIQTIGLAAVVGFFGIGVSLVLFMLALRHLGTARTGAYFSLAPFIGAVVAIVLLHEPVSSRLMLSAALMGFGLWMHLSERHVHDHEHEALEHEHLHVHDEHHRHTHEGPVTEPHSHRHWHKAMRHSHPHYPDIHHRHAHPRARMAASPATLLGAGSVLAAIGAIYVSLAPRLLVPATPREELSSGPVKQIADVPAPVPARQAAQLEHTQAASRTEPEADRAGIVARLPNGLELSLPEKSAEADILARLRDGRRAKGTAWFRLERVVLDPGNMIAQPSFSRQIENVAKLLAAYPRVRMIVGVHFRAGGDDRREIRRAKACAALVLREFARLGVARSRLETRILGADHPVSSNGGREWPIGKCGVSVGLIGR